MNAITMKTICILIGYVCGSFLTACAVTRLFTGESVSKYGLYGNPGMANVMANVGKRAGILVLLGDLAKVIVAVSICNLLFGEQLGDLAILYAGTGTCFGHCYPFWRRFKGGKAVTTICATLILYSFPFGTAAALLGFGVVLLTHFLSIGGTAIPIFFSALAFFFISPEAGYVGLVLSVLGFIRHYSGMKKDLTGVGREFHLRPQE